MAERRTPFNLEAEQSLLGAILLNNDAFHRVSHIVTAESFLEPLHEKIFAAIARTINNGRVAGVVGLLDNLPEMVEDMPMSAYLARLCAVAPTVLNAIDYAHVIADLALKRSLISIADGIQYAATDSDGERTASDLLDEAETQLYSLSSTGGRRYGFRAFTDAVNASLEMAAAAYQSPTGLSGLPTGFDDLDKQMGGLQRSDMIIVAGRPGMGKSAFATNIAYNLARTYDGEGKGARVGFFSLEMSGEQLATRIISSVVEIPSSMIRRGNFHESQYQRYANAAREIEQAPLYIDDAGGQSIATISSTARRLHRQKGLDLIVVDYLQLLSGSGRQRAENRVQELTEITTRLKGLAKELNVPIIALSQLSRQVESREDKRPMLSDLRESGSIEQDADVVLFVYREEYYLKNKEPREGTPEYLAWQEQMQAVTGRAEIIIAKQRHGATGTVPLHFDAELTQFSNLVRRDYGAQNWGAA